MLEVGEVVHVIERRTFENDLRRHFVGIVERVSENSFRATGYAFVFDSNRDTYVRSQTKRTRILAVGSSGLIINVAPEGTDVENVRYVDVNGHLTVTDYEAFSLSVNEFGTRN
jgi:hypothetical protein